MKVIHLTIWTHINRIPSMWNSFSLLQLVWIQAKSLILVVILMYIVFLIQNRLLMKRRFILKPITTPQFLHLLRIGEIIVICLHQWITQWLDKCLLMYLLLNHMQLIAAILHQTLNNFKLKVKILKSLKNTNYWIMKNSHQDLHCLWKCTLTLFLLLQCSI